MTDLSSNINTSMITATTQTAKNSTNVDAGESLDMTDFLTLMVTMLENQSIDDTADMSEMMSMMVQMTTIETLTNVNTLLNDSTTLTYAASLVGKNVTIGLYTGNGNELKEIYGEVTGTGLLGGEQVIFLDDDPDKCYYLTDILAVGKLPDEALTDVVSDDDEDSDIDVEATDTGTVDTANETNTEEAVSETYDTVVDAASQTPEDGIALSNNDSAWDLVSG